MRSHLRSLVIGAGFLFGLASPAYAEGVLVFSEVYPDDGSTNRQHEYLEVVNRGDTPLALHDWALTTKTSAQDEGALARFPSTVHLRPGQSFLIALDETALWESDPELRIDAHLFEGSGGGYTLASGTHPTWGSGTGLALPASEKRLLIIAPDGSISDGITWDNGQHTNATALPPRSDKSYAWKRSSLSAEQGPLGPWLLVQRQADRSIQWSCAPAQCGNGFLEDGETCDDGNLIGGDGCSPTCTIEAGASCVHNELPCGGSSVRPTHCYFPADVCDQDLRLTAVHLWAEDGVGYQCQDWLEFVNASSSDFPLFALQITEDPHGGAGSFAGRDAFAPSQWLSPGERAVVMDRLEPLLRRADSHPAERCPIGPQTGFSSFFGGAPPRWFARWTANPSQASARWDDRAMSYPVQLYPYREQLSAYCRDDLSNFDVFAFAQEGEDDGALPTGWSGPRARWYPELLRYNVMQHVVFRRYPESQDTDTKADWHLSRCPLPGRDPSVLEAPIRATSLVRQLPHDGLAHRVVLSEEARQRADGQIWMVPPSDPRIEVLASEGSVLFRGVSEPAIFELEWFALTPCWASEKYTATVRFGDAVRCFPDADGDGFGDATAAGVIVGGSCEPGFVDNADDCDDSEGAIHPGALELCDGVDNDCNPSTPDGKSEPWFEQRCDGSDADLCEDGRMLCIFATAYCLENSPTKLDYCDGIDNDCNPATPDGADDPRVGIACDGEDPDLCADGLTVCANANVSCDETTPPGRVELCDGVDNDCNPATPDGYDEALFGQRCTAGVGACTQSATYLCQNSAMICPATPRLPAGDDTTCDGVDNDCNGLVDDGVLDTPLRCGVGACEATGAERCEDGRYLSECVPLAPVVESYESGNCSDGIDNDCDGLPDALDPDCQPLRACYYDADGDGYPGTPVELRVPDCDGTWEGHELWEISMDCNDDPDDACAPRAWNGAAERCDGCDNDCDGRVDETFPSLGQRCDDGADYCTSRSWECNDSGDALFCGAPVPRRASEAPKSTDSDDTCSDGLDNDCDGLIDAEDPDCALVYSGGGLFGCAAQEGAPTWWLPLLTLSAVALLRTRKRARASR